MIDPDHDFAPGQVVTLPLKRKGRRLLGGTEIPAPRTVRLLRLSYTHLTWLVEDERTKRRSYVSTVDLYAGVLRLKEAV